MKKVFSLILILVIISCTGFMLAEALTDADLDKNLKDTAISIWDTGLVNFLKGGLMNIFLFICALVGLGRIIVKFTPSRKDDIWYNKYIIGSLNFIGKYVSFGIATDKVTSKKK